jgi:hypothetical protein
VQKIFSARRIFCGGGGGGGGGATRLRLAAEFGG